ncbi:MAG TPA: tRNA (adenosine(37)-N6)-threonylcarbamoyltransferase complex dimerization subunit type 1 TsaB [Gemmatimonadales bacterium]|jgi:tRNA threonylcarbamoyladenosine biosynthesis protein TsaB|nr:tRNA (adenosine(37)-N6)-threonylcarbamoyltransferase complex dimerization subunit type 1 TsaB [Gemmatimonadales bacterium]
MFLALDTATDRASLALGLPGAEPLEESIGGARRHAAALLPAVQRLLQRAGASLDDLRGIVLSDGPGSFTGLRVGVSVAKALVQARSLPLWTAPSLLVRAAGVARGGELVLAVANALRGEVYAAAYRFLPEGIQTELIPSVRRPEELAESGLHPTTVVGEAPAEIVAILEHWVGKQIIGPPEGSPRAARLLDLLGQRGGARQVQAVREWEPVYGRPAEAQARWESAHGRPLPDSVGSPG